MKSNNPEVDRRMRQFKWHSFTAESLLNAAPDAMLVVNQAGRIVAANIQAERLFGCTRATLTGKSVEERMPSRLRVGHEQHRKSFLRTPQARPMGMGLDLFVLRDDGTEIPVDISLSPLVVGANTFVITAIHDATERRHMEELKRSEAILSESEERFRSIANSAPVLMWMSGSNKQCTYFNKTWLDFTGRSIEAELGIGWTDGVYPADLKRCLDTYTQSFDRREKFKMEYRLRRYDGEYRWVLDLGVPRFNPDCSLAGYVGSCVDVTDSKHVEEALASVSRALIEGQEQERTRIARELHDDIAQRLTLLTIELGQLQDDVSDLPARLRNRVRQIGKQAFEIGADTQSLSHELHSSTLEYMGLVPAMRGFCKNFGDQQMAQIAFTARRIPPTVPNDISLSLFRVMQEALHNALKHSGVRRFEVEVQGSLTEISLKVRDSGAGFDPKLAGNSQGLGLISMKERINLVNGTLSITSKPGSGTEITVRVPLLAETGAAQGKSA